MATCGVDNSLTFASDPNNSSSLSAVAVYGAINVNWNYPSVNPHAVAHVILRRATSSAGIGAQHAIVKGNQYRDGMAESQSGITYYYWIQVVSVNGTTLATLGPASATARSLSADTSDLLDGLIDSSSLAAALRSDIEDIPSLRSDLIDETTGRLQALSDVDTLLDGLGLDVTQTFADIVTERTTRIDGDNVLASQVSAIAASNGQNLAAIITEQTARVTADSAEASLRTILAARVTSTESEIVANEAAIVTEQNARATADGALSTQVNSVIALSVNTYRQASPPPMTNGENIGSLWFETDNKNKPHRWSGTAWENAQDGDIADAFAAVQSEQTARTSAISALASDVTTVESSVTVLNNTTVPGLNTDISALDTDIGNVAGDLASFEALVPSTISAQIQTNNTTAVGYCMIGGVPSTATNRDTQSECEGAGGTWLPLREIAQAVKGVQVDNGPDTASIQQHMSSYRSELGVLNSQYTVKIQQHANGNYLFGGFGLSVNNQLQTIDAGFDVDTFWIGRVGDASPAGHAGSGRYPFKLVDNKVYIETAIVENLSVGTLKIAGKAITHTEAERFFMSNVQYFTDGVSGYNWRNGTVSDESNSILSAGGSNNGFDSGDVAQVILGGVSGESYNVIVHLQLHYGLKTRSSNDGRAVSFQPRLQVKKNGIVIHNITMQKVVNSAKQFFNNAQIYQYTYVYENVLDAQATYTFGLAESNYFFVDSQWGDYIATDSDIIEYGFIKNPSYIIHFLKR